jgi:hypothetical protein
MLSDIYQYIQGWANKEAQMCSKIATAPTRDMLPQEHDYTTVATRADILEIIGQLPATGCTRFSLITITLLYQKSNRRTGAVKTRQAEHARLGTAYLLQNIRGLVRKTDKVLLHEQKIYFVLREADLQGAQIVEERLWEALLWRTHNMGTQESPRPQSMTISHAAYPEPHTTLDDLLNAVERPARHFGTVPERAVYHIHKRSTRHEEPITSGDKEELPLLAQKLGIPYLSLLPGKLPHRVLHALNARLARELRCYPIGRERNMLTVAMLNPQDHTILERLHQETGLHIFPVLTHPEALERALKQLH